MKTTSVVGICRVLNKSNKEAHNIPELQSSVEEKTSDKHISTVVAQFLEKKRLIYLYVDHLLIYNA